MSRARTIRLPARVARLTVELRENTAGCAWWAGILYMLLMFWPSPVVASEEQSKLTQLGVRDAIVTRAWLDDPDGTMPAQVVLEHLWQPFQGPLSRGFTRSVTWVRLKIDPGLLAPPSTPSDHRVVLRITPGRLDEVSLYRVDRLTAEPVRVGDTLITDAPQKGVLDHAVILEDVHSPLEVLLRVQTQGNHSIHVQAMRWDESLQAVSRDFALVMAYLVFTLMVITWAIVTWADRRETVLGLFIAHQILALLTALTFLGVLRVYGPHLLAAIASDLTSLIIPLSALLTILFHGRLLSDLGARRLEIRILYIGTALPALGFLLVAFGERQTGLLMTHVSIALLMPVVIIAAARIQLNAESTKIWRRVFAVSVYVAMSAVMLPQSLRVLGLLQAGAWSYNAYFAYGVASPILLSSLLLLRSREARQRRKHADLVLAQARGEAEAQRVRAAEQAELMTMLTHELKTPLSVVSLALGRSGQQQSVTERAHRAVRNMRDVIDRCAEAARVDDDRELMRPNADTPLGPLQLAELITEAVNIQLQPGRVELQIDHDLPPCRGDRQMLLVIIGNLIENALKYSPEGSKIELRAISAVADGRPGVAMRVVNPVGAAGLPDGARLFEKYHRGARARHRSGSGLGLYLSKRLADRQGVKLALLDLGSAQVGFEMWLPT